MVLVKTVKNWILPSILCFLFSAIFLHNLQNLEINQLYLDLLTENASFSYFSDKVKAQNPITPQGLQFTFAETIDIPLDSDLNANQFTIKIRFIPETIQAIHFRLWGKPHSLDLSLLDTEFPFYKPGRNYTIEIIRSDDQLDVILQGKKINSEGLSNHRFSHLQIESVKSRFSLLSIDCRSDSNYESTNFSFAPFISTPGKIISLCILSTAFFILISGIYRIRRSRISPLNSTGIVLFFFVPVIAGTLFLTSERIVYTLFVFVAVSMIPLAIHWTGMLPAVAQRVSPVFVLLSISAGIFISLFNKHEIQWIAPAIAVAILSVIGVAYAYTKSRLLLFSRGFSRFLPALIPAALWIVFNLTAEPERQGLTAALIFTSTLMLTILVFASRNHLRSYSFWTLLFLALCLVSAENFAQNSQLPIFIEQVAPGKGYVPDKKLFFVPAEFFEEGSSLSIEKIDFRSGKTSLFPEAGTFRILSMGGSNTWGDAIDSNELTYSGQFKNCIKKQYPANRIEVINAGTKGYKLFQILQFYKHYCAQYHPDLIVLMVNTLDSELDLGPYTIRELWEMNNEGTLQNLKQTSPSEKSRAQSPHWVISLQKILKKSSLYNGLTRTVSKQKEGPLKPLSERFGLLKETNPAEEYRAHLQSFIELARKNGSRIVLVDEFYATYVKEEDKKGAKIREIMKQSAKEYSVGYIPLNDGFGARPDKMSLVFDYDKNHLNLKGHQEVASRICRFLIKNNYLNPD